MRVILSGGGTGGHIYPAIAVADALKARREDIDILFVGAQGKMEMDVVPRQGYNIEGLPIRGVQRRMDWRNLKVPFLIMDSIRRAGIILRDFDPQVVAGFGGYASAPIVYVAQRKAIPTLIQEQNSYAGWTNRVLAKKADAICVAFAKMEKYFPEEKLHFTGNPVRQGSPTTDLDSILVSQRNQYKKTILIIGGSLGAKTLNEAMRASAELWKSHPSLGVVWQCGTRYHDAYKDCETALLPNVELVPFIQDMDRAYREADIVISRAGALSISELALYARAAVLVPSPNVTDDHQFKNAQSLVQADAAWMVEDDRVKEELMDLVLRCLEDEKGLNQKRKNIKNFSPKGAADDIAGKLIELAQNTKV